MNHWRAARRDSGETLIEILAAVVIIGLAGVAIVTAMTVSIRLSDYHRKQATSSAILHNYAEKLAAAYLPCSAANSQPYTLPAQSGFGTPVIVVAYWTGTAFGTTSCPPGGDPGVQRVTLTVTSTDNRVSDNIIVVLRNP